jgi:hypothetical protein
MKLKTITTQIPEALSAATAKAREILNIKPLTKRVKLTNPEK